MRLRPTFWIVPCLLLAAGAWFFWPHAERVAAGKFEPPIAGAFRSASTAPQIFPLKAVSKNSGKTGAAAAKTNRFAWRLSNTTKSIGELVNDRHAILLENALIDTRAKLDFSIPKNLQAQGDPGAYVVQADGTMGPAFRAMLSAAGAQIVSYIPNNAYLVRVSAGGANAMAANPLAQSVIPYEPYYKVQSPLIAYDQTALPAGAILNLGLFADNAAATIKQIEKLGGTVLSQESEPFGLEVRVQPPSDWTALAQLPGVQIVEQKRTRELANDLSRVTTGVAVNTTTNVNYLGLTGKNVVVAEDDSGVDATHPDFAAGRVIGDAPQSLVDMNGHGTFVAGEIAGNGAESTTVTNASGSVTNADFRGMAPMATLYSVGGIDGGADTNVISDRYLQESAALTNALIANESWGYGGDNLYDLAAASYDAATRDALMGVTGPQPVLFVFAAGNDGHIGTEGGNGDNDGGGGTPDSLSSPATAKDVLTVGALEQLRNITNIVTALDGTSNAVWKAATDSSSQVADYSSRGNVGIGTEGTFGRFKPDVVAPGSFVISTRSQQWDQQAYYNPSNTYVNDATFQLVDTNSLNYYNFPFVVQNNAVSVSIRIQPNDLSPVPFPTNMPIYVSLNNYPPPSDFMTVNDNVTIPTDGGAGYLQSIINNLGGFNFEVGDSTNIPVNYDLVAEMTTTNDMGDYYTVLSNLNNTLGPYYRYESGTSMAAADVSGVLALMQDYFTNTLRLTPSPALLKAMLINGARPTGFYNLQVNNNINLEGWGLVNLPNSIPAGITNMAATATNSFFFADQSPTNALATGDSRTYTISLSPGAMAVPLRLTLAWTDPPGNPAAAIKLVNNLDLIVTNMDNTNVYYGNDIGPNQVFNTPESSTNAAPGLDGINNIENVFLPANAGTNFTVVIRGTAVNVNAVTANTNNTVQDFAFVISSGNGSNTNGFAVTGSSFVSDPTGGQRITVITATNASPLMDQFVGASSPLLGTNTVGFGANTNELVTMGQTNQWHFYIWTNYCGQYAAFVTFLPPTAAIPVGGTKANSDANSTRPEADIDVFATTDPGLTNLDPNVIANCITNPQVGASVGVNFYGAALDRGGSEFVVDTNSATGRVYYIGVQSEDQTASQYAFLGLCSETPFSSLDNNGNESAAFYPVDIPDGDATHPGYTNSLALTIFPMEIERVVVTNTLTQQNAGDLVISVDHSTVANGSGSVVLLNHDSPNGAGTYTTIYDDSGENDILNSRPSDGPGSLGTFTGQQGMGVWLLHVSDNAPSFVGSDQGSLFIQPHIPLGNGTTNTLAAGKWYYNFIDVPPGATNLTISVTNLNGTLNALPLFSLDVFVKLGSRPTTNNFDKMMVVPATTPPPPPGNSLTVSLTDVPPLQPGRYYVGVYNPNPAGTADQTFSLFTAILPANPIGTPVDFASAGPVPLLDDAVTVSSNSVISITNTEPIVSVNVGIVVQHPRISDLAFTLISPDGQRILLMENRGGDTTSGAGAMILTTNSIANFTAAGTTNASTNFVIVSQSSGTLPVSWDFFQIPDEMTIYDTTNNFTPANLIFDTGMVSGTGQTNLPYTTAFGALTIIMNQFGNTNGAGGDAWTYTAGGVATNYAYLTFTEDTNLTTTPIKFAVPPFVPAITTPTNILTDGFEQTSAGDYTNGKTFGNGWTVTSNQVSVVTDTNTTPYGSNFLALANGVISTNLPTVAGQTYTLTFAYRGPGIVGWWRGESNAVDSINADNGTLLNGATYAPGIIGTAFNFNGGGAQVWISDQPDLRLTNSITIEQWIFQTSQGSYQNPIGKWDAGNPSWNQRAYAIAISPSGQPYFVVCSNGTPTQVAVYSTSTIPLNQWTHLAATYDGTSLKIFVNGILEGQAAYNQGIFPGTDPLGIGVINGGVSEGQYTSPFSGHIDETSIYQRALSASEIQAIYQDMTKGKFDANVFNTSPAQSLAEAQVSVNGRTSGTLYGNNTNWQTKTITFTATQNGTPLQISGIEPGMLLDDFVLTQEPGNLYYLPEQSLASLDGENAQGNWTLEIQDDRAGAYDLNNPPALVSWELQFVFADTNAVPSVLSGGIGQSNQFIPVGDIAWYQINVPAAANYATNILKFASAPVNVWFSANVPPTITNPGDVDLIPNSTNNTNGPAILSTNTTPLLVPGSTYYLGVQNTGSSTVNYGIEVDFDRGNSANSTLPQLVVSKVVQTGGGKIQFQWTASSSSPVEVQWTTNLASRVWNTITNPATTTSNGVSTFTDDGSQTAPLGAVRFYRLVQVSP
ncbi:MAG TPA: S8 family serine peptidase [Verrucomicrobiae bacterium]